MKLHVIIDTGKNGEIITKDNVEPLLDLVMEDFPEHVDPQNVQAGIRLAEGEMTYLLSVDEDQENFGTLTYELVIEA